MPCDRVLHNAIDKYNFLQKPTEQIRDFVLNHPNYYKAALVANHIFRAVSMAAFHVFLPFTMPVNLAVCFVGSLFYRLTVETNCAYKFALPAFVGGAVLPMAWTAASQLVSGVALASLGAFATATLGLIPLAGYITYIALTVNYDVNEQCRPFLTP